MGSSIQRFGIAIKLTLTLFNFISSGVKSVRFSRPYFNPKLFQIVGSMLDTKWTEEVDNGISLNILIFGSVIECCLLSLILIISTCANNDTETLLCACEKIPLLLIIGLIEGPLLYWLGLSSYYTIGYPRKYRVSQQVPDQSTTNLRFSFSQNLLEHLNNLWTQNSKFFSVEIWYSVWLVSTLFQSLATLLLGCDC